MLARKPRMLVTVALANKTVGQVGFIADDKLYQPVECAASAACVWTSPDEVSPSI
jgi:hypothetical protein